MEGLENFKETFEAFREKVRDRIRGSLMAGAAGDALGYTVEFISRSSILSRYGAL